MSRELYGFAHVTCLKNMRLPLYERTLHYQGIAGTTYAIECYDEGEVDYYRNMCRQLPNELFFNGLYTAKNNEYSQIGDGGHFGSNTSGTDPGSDIIHQGFSSKLRQWIDGKDFSEDPPIRNHYDCGTF